MSELKTLKDFQTYPYEWESHEFVDCIPNYKLKQEAIKHIKKWDSGLHPASMSHNLAHKYRRQAFMDFFNITEEDLQ